MSIRTAILGYGRNGSTMHAGGVANNDAFDMAAVCDIDPEQRAQASERFGCPVYEDYHAMLEREALDLVCIVTRSDQHCRMTCDCLAAGVHVLVTKPWAVNEAEARRMAAAQEASGKLLLPWLPARWGCDFQRLRALVAERVIGRLLIVRRTVCSFGTRCDWQTERRYGGGYLLNWGLHLLDPAILLAGSRPRSVYGRMMKANNPGDGEDLFLALVNLENGTLVHAEYTVAIESLPSWYVQGTRGTIVVYDHDRRVHRSTPAEPGDPTQFSTMAASNDEVIEEHLEGEVYGDTDAVYVAIAQALQGQKAYPVSTAEALALTRLLDAIRVANDENRIVAL